MQYLDKKFICPSMKESLDHQNILYTRSPWTAHFSSWNPVLVEIINL